MNSATGSATATAQSLPPPYERVMTADAIDVAATLAREMSVDPTVLANVCAELSTRQPQMKDRAASQQDALASQLLDLLIESVNLEVVATSVGRSDMAFHVYLFGIDRPLFCFSLACLATNPTVSACVLRMVSSGYERDGERFFRRRYMAPDKSRLEYRDFAFNELFSRHFFRAPMFLHFIMSFLSGIDIYFADRYPSIEVAQRGAVLLERVIADVDSRLAQTLHLRGAAALPWVLPSTTAAVNRLKSADKSLPSVIKLFSTVIAEHVKTYVTVKC